MAIAFNSADFEQVRKAIDLTLTADELPDAVIGYDIFKAEAVAAIESALSGLTEQQITDNAAEIKRAAVLMTASLIAPKIQVLTSETLEGDKFTFQNKDLAKIAHDLEIKAYTITGRILAKIGTNPPVLNSDFASGLFTTAKANPK